MLELRDKEILFHIIEHCENIISYINDVKLNEFLNNKMLQDSVLFNIFLIGELSKSLSNDFINKHNKMPWKEIKGMRDIIGHGYQTISLERTYNTAVDDIKDLCKYCKTIYKEK